MEHRFFGDGSMDQRRLHHDDGHCPLHDAATEGNVDIVKLLLSAGANVNLINKFDMTPLALAEWYERSYRNLGVGGGGGGVSHGGGHVESRIESTRRYAAVVQILKNHGARNNVRCFVCAETARPETAHLGRLVVRLVPRPPSLVVSEDSSRVGSAQEFISQQVFSASGRRCLLGRACESAGKTCWEKDNQVGGKKTTVQVGNGVQMHPTFVFSQQPGESERLCLFGRAVSRSRPRSVLRDDERGWAVLLYRRGRGPHVALGHDQLQPLAAVLSER